MKRTLLSFLLFVTVSLSAKANNLTIENVAYDQVNGTLTFDISWENSWNLNDDYHDAVWVFAKYKAINANEWRPFIFDDNNGNVASFSGNDLQFSAKNVGLMVRSTVQSVIQNNIPTTTVTISGLSIVGINPSVKVFGIEMVNVPGGNFYAGDDSGINRTFDLGIDQSPMFVTDTTTQLFTTGGTGPINLPENYPVGVDAFYCMKYEITQGQVVNFLNTLSYDNQDKLSTIKNRQAFKYPFSSSDDVVNRMGIAIEEASTSGLPIKFAMDLNDNGVFDEIDDGATLACNYLSFLELFAYLDWAGLRPMTELEYEKACRGVAFPIANEYASGARNRGPILFTVDNAGTPDESSTGTILNLHSGFGPMRVGFSATGSASRLTSGNSFYGIANLSDNVSELTMRAESYSRFDENVHGDGTFDNVRPLGAEPGWEIIFTYRGGSFSNDGSNQHLGTVSYRVRTSTATQYEGGRGVVSF